MNQASGIGRPKHYTILSVIEIRQRVYESVISDVTFREIRESQCARFRYSP